MEFPESRFEADLNWLQCCPDLVLSDHALDLDHEIKEPRCWDPVTRFLETKAAHRVGYYVESLFQVWLESNPEITDLQHSIQIRQEKETLGELDFLFRREGKLQHLEVVLKFYLCYPEGAENGSRFVGPNATDSFERKRDRLLGKQLPFGKEFYPEIEQSLHAVKGMIFYHRYVESTVELPDRLNPDHARGWWLRQGELKRFLSEWSDDVRGRILRKPYWLSPSGPLLSRDEVQRYADEHFNKWDGPVFLAVFADGKALERVFVMPDFWPAKSG